MASISMQMLEQGLKPEQALALILKELKRRTDTTGLDEFYPDDGPLRRELYTKHIKMLEAGAVHDERVAMGGNRVGKTKSIGGYETAIHLTGLYPEWWKGKRFEHAVRAWACGTKSSKVRDVNQAFLLGKIDKSMGFTSTKGALIPSAKILRMTRKTGTADAIDQVYIKHVSGGESVCTFKSYEEGRTSFESEELDWIWLDEEPPKPIYDECKMRLLTSRGQMLSTFTPVEGMTETVLALLEGTEFI